MDSEGTRIMLPQTKNGDGRIVYLNTLAIEALSAVAPPKKAKSTDRIFSAEPINPENVSFVKISDFRFHDLRHTAASWMRMKGADIHTVALILGHKDLRMAARYQHLSPAFLSDAVKLLDGAYAEKPQNAEAETPKEPANENNSSSIVTVALPALKVQVAA
jgi:integrase